jgi:hypothetical protein
MRADEGRAAGAWLTWTRGLAVGPCVAWQLGAGTCPSPRRCEPHGQRRSTPHPLPARARFSRPQEDGTFDGDFAQFMDRLDAQPLSKAEREALRAVAAEARKAGLGKGGGGGDGDGGDEEEVVFEDE